LLLLLDDRLPALGSLREKHPSRGKSINVSLDVRVNN